MKLHGILCRAFNAVKATSRAHDKKVALVTNKNYNALQSVKPWASPDDVSAFNRGRGFPSQRGRGLHMRLVKKKKKKGGRKGDIVEPWIIEG